MTIQMLPYRAAFDLLLEDLRRLLEYVEPVDANLQTYSHRIYELLLRACTEFESVCKELLAVTGIVKAPKRMDVNVYKTLENTLHLQDVEVGFHKWSPMVRYVKPFENWSTATPTLIWYSNYNKVKHNRYTEFELANLDNLMLALCGLFCMLARNRVFDHGMYRSESFAERYFEGVPFSVRGEHSVIEQF